MKRLFVLFTALFVAVISFSQNIQTLGNVVIGFNEYNIFQVSREDGYYIGIELEEDERDNKCMILIDKSDLPAFRRALLDLQKKYDEWTMVAKENTITELVKQFPVIFPNVTIAWWSPELCFDLENELIFNFCIQQFDEFTFYLAFASGVSESFTTNDSKNWNFFFSKPNQVTDLYFAISNDIITAKLKEDELFN